MITKNLLGLNSISYAATTKEILTTHKLAVVTCRHPKRPCIASNHHILPRLQHIKPYITSNHTALATINLQKKLINRGTYSSRTFYLDKQI